MAFSFAHSLVKHTLKYGGNALGGVLGGGVVPLPIGSIASAVYVDWCASCAKDAKDQVPPAAEQARVRAELEKIVQDPRAYRAQIDQLLGKLGADQPEAVRQAARTYLNQVPGRVQRSLRRPEDPSGRTVPAELVLRRAEDLKQLLPERMPRFQPGDKPVPGTDLVVEELLGVGGFGEVWKASHQSRPHLPPVALKFCIDETAARTLRKEVELLDRVTLQGRHRGMVELRYAHLEANTPCLEYEYVEGGDLACLVTDMHQAGKATPLNMTRLFLTLVQAVGFAHRIVPPIVHRDLKPSNVLTTRVEKRVVLKVSDFGIGGLAAEQEKREAADTGRRSTFTTSSGTCTPLYASPQHRRGAGPDPRDDVYALGVIWYQMLVGDVTKEPPRGGSWKKRLREQGATPKMLVLLERCLEDEPTDRPADAQALVQELLAVIKEVTPGGSKEIALEDEKERQLPRPLRPEVRGSFSDANEARRHGDAAAFWFLLAGVGFLAIMACSLAYVLAGYVRPAQALELKITLLIFGVGLPGVAAFCLLRASGSLKNFRSKGIVYGAILIGFIGLLWAMLVSAMEFEAAREGSRRMLPPLAVVLSCLVLWPTVLVNFFAALRGIRTLWSAAVREQFGRPEESREKLRPAFPRNLVIGLVGGLAGWFLLSLLVVFTMRPGRTITKAGFDNLRVGMSVEEVNKILDPQGITGSQYKPSLGEVGEAFGSGPEELSRKAQWITAHRQGREVVGWKDGDKIILSCNQDGYFGRVDMLCYSYADANGDRVSENKGSVPSKSKVTRENFATLTVGMTRTRVAERLADDRYGSSKNNEFPAAMVAFPFGEDKDSWIKAFNEGMVEVFSDGAGTRILVAYEAKPVSVAGEVKAVAFCFTWTGIVDSDRVIVSKGKLRPLKPAGGSLYAGQISCRMPATVNNNK